MVKSFNYVNRGDEVMRFKQLFLHHISGYKNNSNNMLIIKKVINNLSPYLPDDLDVCDWDAKSIVNNFLKNHKKLADSTISTYVSRLNVAINIYLSSYKYIAKTRTDKAAAIFSIPIPLNRGVVVNILDVPINLTQAEARKISQVILAYANKKVIK